MKPAAIPDHFEPTADASAFVSLGIVFQRCFRLAVLPEQLAVVSAGGKFDHPRDRLEALVNQLRSNIENMSEEGFPEAEGTPGQQTALRTLELVADALREELTALATTQEASQSAFKTLKDLPEAIRQRLRRNAKPAG